MKLIPMTLSEFNIWAPESRRSYAEEKTKANSLTPEEALQIADTDFKRLLPDGLTTKDTFLFSIKDECDNLVGSLWFNLRGAVNNRKAYLCDIVILKSFREKGYGRKAMLLLEKEVANLGLTQIGLHVFGHNESAVRLYQSLGYKTTDLVMAKDITP